MDDRKFVPHDIKVIDRQNGDMLMRDVFVNSRKVGHYYVIPGIAVWASKEREGRKPMIKRFDYKAKALAWIVRRND